jgi:hypothetical protein
MSGNGTGHTLACRKLGSNMGWFLIIVALALAALNANRLRLALQSRRWPRAGGRIEEVAERNPDWSVNGVGPSEWQDVLYRYTVSGRYFTSSRKYFTGLSENWWRPISRSAPEYAAGAEVSVFYDPDDARVSVLIPGLSLGLVADYLVSIMMAAFGCWLALAA